jgi:hypothetical protein
MCVCKAVEGMFWGGGVSECAGQRERKRERKRPRDIWFIYL